MRNDNGPVMAVMMVGIGAQSSRLQRLVRIIRSYSLTLIHTLC